MSDSNDTTNSGIYIIRNLVSGNFYIGQSQNIITRWEQHCKALQGNRHHNRHLQLAWNKYGKSAFEFHVLEYCLLDQLDDREQYYLDMHTKNANCYNIATDARAFARGTKHSVETRNKMSEAKHNISDETRHKMSATRRGRHVSEETRCKISMAQIGRPSPTLGKKHSDESRQKISKALKGRIVSDETRQKMSEAHSGENHPKSKLTDMDIPEIKRMSNDGWTQKAIGAYYGVSHTLICRILRGERWKYTK